MPDPGVHFSSGAGFHNTQAVVTLSLSKGDGLPKEPLFTLQTASFDKLRMLVSRTKFVRLANSEARPQTEIHPDPVLEIKGLDELIGDLEHLPDVAARILTATMEEALRVVQAEIHQRAPIGATGNLAASINAASALETRVILWGIEGVVGTNVPYAVYVEAGTRPHWPPLEPLVEWVGRRHLAGVYSIKSGRRLGSKMTQRQQDVALAKAIQYKIARHGTEAQHVFRDGLAAADDEVQEVFVAAVERILELLCSRG